MLGPYNMFEYVARLCDTMDPGRPKKEVSIMPCRSGLDWQNFVNYTFKHNYYKLLTRCHYLHHGNRLKEG